MEKVKDKVRLDDRVKIKKDVISRRVQDEEVILSLGSGIYFGLDQMGAIFWDKLKTGKTLKSISDEIAQDFEVNSSKVQKDILALVADLKKNNLVQLK